jgi:dihydroorotase
MSVRLVQREGAPASLVIEGARLLDPAGGIDRVGDLVVRDGLIGGEPDGLERVDGAGLLVVPGFVDPHVHLRTPGREDAEDIASGTRAAAAGGFVTILAMPNTKPVVDSGAVLGSLLEQAARDAVVRVGFYAAITVGQEGRALTEQGELAELGAAGFSDDGRPVRSAEVLRRALRYQRVTGGLPMVLHEEDPDLSGAGVMHEGLVSTRLGLAGIPGVSESAMVARDLALAAHEGARVHVCHVSAWETVEELRRARERGVRVSAEVTPHHLVLTDDSVATLDASRFKMNPPLRAAEDREALVEALVDGTIDCVATDHAPHAPQEKEAPFEEAPFGVTGLETSFAALYTHLVEPGLVRLETLLESMSAGPARIFGLDRPRIAVGAPANVTLVDTAAGWKVGQESFRSRSSNSWLLGRTLKAKVRLTIADGRVAFEA